MLLHCAVVKQGEFFSFMSLEAKLFLTEKPLCGLKINTKSRFIKGKIKAITFI